MRELPPATWETSQCTPNGAPLRPIQAYEVEVVAVAGTTREPPSTPVEDFTGCAHHLLRYVHVLNALLRDGEYTCMLP